MSSQTDDGCSCSPDNTDDNKTDSPYLNAYIGPWSFVLICGCCVLFGYFLGSIHNITLVFN